MNQPALGLTRRHFLKVTTATGGGLLIGFYLPDLDAALEWATKGSAACMGPVEVRPFQDEPEG